ncbi:MAG: hypothetical protein UW35_C0032G0004 [Candidatus Collierbacteria bacterium GW2011_GWF2_44_15]|uniref:DUF5652 domain-containing protein n=3 Tax=Candidatus Collieribacteriota TaxID=1752725 RepID=A0A0G1KD87_9BACT|nr:MAG: hypothetical protein UW35_C0032G0004 [Candidatus Collierbacteria bacterium GW2011_GWF2_44_15]KKT97957.1 MAG: hypothetical protein UW99_C0028G0014 [Candidatus Collierbacteria bacterium GW2011_GWC2_45_15]KKU28389.1 MAG: hypothetical protein UX41_C0036G0002 [Candidatus Collierbacteria bacterium GW2011_GWE1_46_18]
MINFTSSSLLRSPFLYMVVIADLVLRGIALYKSARKGQTAWFVALLIINSMGILPIIYLLINKELVFSPAAKPAKKVTHKGKK